MYRRTLLESIQSAKEFIKRANSVMNDYTKDNWFDKGNHVLFSSKASGAMVRASMELSRKLSDLRQNR